MTPSQDQYQEEAGQPKLRLSGLRKTFGEKEAVRNLSLDLERGQLLALLGPSGCGKTTTLRMIAGLETPTSGRITLDGRVLADNKIALPPERRGLGMVFQSYALWPHMTVGENVAFGLKRAGVPKSQIGPKVAEALRLVEMDGSEPRPSSELSGGQQQRVAIARALAQNPSLVLFDEPLSNLDAVLRESMRFEIRELQQKAEMTAVYVTHSQDEALALADQVAVMNDGVIQQLGPPADLYNRPRNSFVAGFVGLANVVRGEVLELGDDLVVDIRGERVRVPDTGVRPDLAIGDDVSLAARPENFRIEGTRVEAGSRTPSTDTYRIRGEVLSVVFSGNLVDYFVRLPGDPTPVRVQSLPPTAANPGDHVDLALPGRNIVLLED
jgi:iron(III) transport system ATP-binding protein